jgi:O-antigen ligase
MDYALARLRAAPAAPLAAAALGVLVFVAAHDDRPSIWRPAALVLLGLLGVAAVGVPVAWRAVPVPVRIAVLTLGAFTAWSFLAIAWADSRGDAWDGADRTLAYFALFTLFALWPAPPRVATVLLGAWAAAMTAIGLVVLFRVSGAHDPAALFVGGRLASPLRYQNASADGYLMAMWPALLLCARRDVPWVARGAAAAAAVVLSDLALLSQSRGAVIAVGICVPLLFLLAVNRRRAYVALVPVAAAIAATAPKLLHDDNRYADGHLRALHGIAFPVLVSALVAGVVVAVLALIDTRWRPAGATRARARRVLGWVVIASAVVVVGGGLVAAGDPVHRVRHLWHSFTRSHGVTTLGGSHLAGGLGSNRYDFYRVAWGQFRRSPIVGAGTEQFFQDYLARGHSTETPHYPHSIELRTLAELGLVGALLLLGFLGAAAWAIANARRGPPTAGATAVAGAMGFALWLIHGSGDWFFEIFAIGAPAFALLGLACGLAPRTAVEPARRRGWRQGVAVGAGGLALLAAALSFALPWIAARDVDQAATGWPADPAAAFRRLDRAADLNPLSDEAQTTAGTIALRQGDLAHAARAFRAALKRDARDDYATLELGAIAGAQGDFPAAIALLGRAHALYTHDQFATEALARVRAGKRIDIQALNDAIERRGVD